MKTITISPKKQLLEFLQETKILEILGTWGNYAKGGIMGQHWMYSAHLDGMGYMIHVIYNITHLKYIKI